MERNPLDDLTDEQVREIAEEGDRIMSPLLAAVNAGLSGSLPCPCCAADMPWSRTGREWRADCPMCHWGACGAISAEKVAN